MVSHGQQGFQVAQLALGATPLDARPQTAAIAALKILLRMTGTPQFPFQLK